jgi:tetratricopeptide (TPR) repeat protein
MGIWHMRDRRVWINASEEPRMTEAQKLARQAVQHKLRDGTYRLRPESCPTCQRSDFEALARFDRYGLDYPVGMCRGCGLVQVSPRPDPEALADFYARHYRSLYGTTVQAGLAHSRAADERGRIALQYLSRQGLILPGETVVEIGCGAGGQLLAFQAAGCVVRGYDHDTEALARGREAAALDLRAGGIETCLRDVDHGAPRPRAVLYIHVFEHLSDPRAELRHLAELLGSEGLVYLEVPGLSQALRSREVWFDSYFEFAHTFYFDRDTLLALAAACGWHCLWADDHVRAVLAPPGARRADPRQRVPAVIAASGRARDLLAIDPLDHDAALEAQLRGGSDHAQALFRIGEVLFARKDPRALAFLERAQLLEPDRGKYAFLLARAMLTFEGTPLARRLAMLETSVRLLPEAPWPLFHLGKTLAEAGRHDEALGAYARAIRLQSETALFHYWQAHSWKGADHLTRARDGFARARALDPALAWAAYHEGVCLLALDAPLKARAAFADAFAVRPEPLFAEARDRIAVQD